MVVKPLSKIDKSGGGWWRAVKSTSKWPIINTWGARSGTGWSNDEAVAGGSKLED
jgi:hypothetical protein